MEETRYYDLGATFEDGRYLSDKEVADYVKKHMRPEDQKDVRKVTECALMSFAILSGDVEFLPEDGYFYDDMDN